MDMAGMLSRVFSRTIQTASPVKNGEDAAEQLDEQMEQEVQTPEEDVEIAEGSSDPVGYPEARSAKMGGNQVAQPDLDEEGEQEEHEDEEDDDVQDASESASEEEVHKARRTRKARKIISKIGSSDDESHHDSHSASSDSEEAQWDGESEEEGETKTEALNPNRCM